jgi:hypothetical protein
MFHEKNVVNVAWVWTPVASPPPPADWGRDPDWQAYYPGDEYVDWVGADLNDWGQLEWLGAMFDYFESHPKIKTVSYFNCKNNPDPDPRSPDHVFPFDRRVNYIPNVDDHDQRLIAGGDDMRALFSARIGNPRYVSALGSAP